MNPGAKLAADYLNALEHQRGLSPATLRNFAHAVHALLQFQEKKSLEDLEPAFKAVGRADGLVNLDTPLFTTTAIRLEAHHRRVRLSDFEGQEDVTKEIEGTRLTRRKHQ